ncbi:MAG TPA: hypothetical protein VEY67_10960 [Candidatus Dormibacteraeota bacterium]|nr:hypothetical protein [Candidatus Dormibacteraeota bacterium]
MPIDIEAYTAEGILTGRSEASGRLREMVEILETVRVAPVTVLPLHGTPRERGEDVVPTDELLLVVPEPVEGPVHTAWHDIRLSIGPWRVDAVLATAPGLDPGRALIRPGGTFIGVHDASVYRRVDPERPVGAHLDLLVNRYAVEEVECELALPFHFPGATIRQVAPVLGPTSAH